MNIEIDHSRAKSFETILRLQQFMTEAPRELGLTWSAFVLLANLASADFAYLSAAELIEKTAGNRCCVYHNLRILLALGLIDSIKQPASGNQERRQYSVNGKGLYWLEQSLKPNGIRLIKALERP